MIVFGEMDELKLIALSLQKFRGCLEQMRIALEFTLMIACSQAWIVDKNFLCL